MTTAATNPTNPTTPTAPGHLPTYAEIEREALDHTRALVSQYAAAVEACTARAELADEIGAQLIALADDLRHACESRIRMPDDADGPFQGLYERPAGTRPVEQAADNLQCAARDAWGQAGAWRRMRRQLDARRIELVAELDWLDDSDDSDDSDAVHGEVGDLGEIEAMAR